MRGWCEKVSVRLFPRVREVVQHREAEAPEVRGQNLKGFEVVCLSVERSLVNPESCLSMYHSSSQAFHFKNCFFVDCICSYLSYKQLILQHLYMLR